MDRRTFVLLTGTVSLTAFDRPRPPGAVRAGRMRFELDDRRRWSLWYYGDAQPVALLRDAEVVAWVGDQPVTLAELEDSTVGSRRPPGGTAVVVRGRGGGRGLGLAFDAGEPGEARVALSRDGLEAVSAWLPTRPLRPAGDASRLRIGYAPDGDGLDALRAVFALPSPLDQERLAQAVAPAGWCSASGQESAVTEADVVANAEFCAAHFDRRFLRYIRVDDGYQKAAGDWETNEKFPSGHRALTDRIHANGFKAGLWMAPFAVSERSGVPAAHPDWLLRDTAAGPLAGDTREAWGGKMYALDVAHT